MLNVGLIGLTDKSPVPKDHTSLQCNKNDSCIRDKVFRDFHDDPQDGNFRPPSDAKPKISVGTSQL